MKISFCVTCKGRLSHLCQTLPANLRETEGFETEFVILDYNCPDNTQHWIRKNVNDDRVRVYKTGAPVFYDSSHAKNIAHRLASGDILFSLDADNMVTSECVRFVLKAFREAKVVMRGGFTPGRYGQIAIGRNAFEYMRGYDEGLPPGWGGEDVDLVARAVALGLRLRRIPQTLTHIIHHPPEMRMVYFPVKDWKASNRERLAARRKSIVSNLAGEWGTAADLVQ
jgi:glycosyltransferase involved in cell wall biosynthesis